MVDTASLATHGFVMASTAGLKRCRIPRLWMDILIRCPFFRPSHDRLCTATEQISWCRTSSAVAEVRVILRIESSFNSGRLPLTSSLASRGYHSTTRSTTYAIQNGFYCFVRPFGPSASSSARAVGTHAASFGHLVSLCPSQVTRCCL